MKIGSYTNRTSGLIDVTDIKVFKPVQKIIIKAQVHSGADFDLFKSWFDAQPENVRVSYFGSENSSELGGTFPSPSALVRLIDSVTASNKEIVAQTKLSTLSEIASRFEGFFRICPINVDEDYKVTECDGYTLYSIMLCEDGAVSLSNDKYLQLDMFDLIPGVSYDIYGFEYVVQSGFCRTYSKFYLAPTELEKQYSVGEFDYIALPLSKLKEIQFFAKDGQSSPIYTPDELKFDAEMTNDIVSLGLFANNTLRLPVFGLGNMGTAENPVYRGWTGAFGRFGFGEYVLLNIQAFSHFVIKQQNDAGGLMFMLLDTVA